MSAHGGPHEAGLVDFAFDETRRAQAETILKRYPADRRASAVMPLLTIAQAQFGGWLPREVVDYVADYVGMPRIRAYEVASFYDMYNTEPVGRIQVRVCTTTPCMLCGSDGIVDACKKELGVDIGESTPDGQFFLREFECLGACANAPIVWIDDDFYEDQTPESVKDLLDALKRGERPTPGSAKGRVASAPLGERTSLLGKEGQSDAS
ncbi:NADH-quinone oxidoreductase subunit NuoE [Marinivivus vitaminiproducens]|uniref:NADH-quinone oxidoreductase subunit NuoE n=1 Tax=Marinivivus vitaminiproducens TaxID=3035935 RepID=UPI00279FB500|nr:NADH-quinone oxidoreductase subunit NuoE [Geminicoccaceae bacterium SCSIO 64248]